MNMDYRLISQNNNTTCQMLNCKKKKEKHIQECILYHDIIHRCHQIASDKYAGGI